MPLQRRLPKVGFRSRKARISGEIRLGELSRIEGDEVTLDSLLAAGLIDRQIKQVKLIKSGSIERAVKVRGIATTAGAKSAIEAAGGSVEE
jgi:large subunit ribosomal protein L15